MAGVNWAMEAGYSNVALNQVKCEEDPWPLNTSIDAKMNLKPVASGFQWADPPVPIPHAIAKAHCMAEAQVPHRTTSWLHMPSLTCY